MRYLFPACLLLITGCASTAPATEDTPPSEVRAQPEPVVEEREEPADNYYQSTLATLKAKGDRAGIRDFQRLREAYVESDTYNPYLDPASNLVKSGLEQLDNKQWQSCVKTAADIVEINYTNLAGQYIGMVCNLNAGNKAAGDDYRFSLDGLLEAIWSTGNGKTTETAFHTYSTAEQRAFLQLHNLEIVDQAMVRGGKGIFDVVKVRDPASGREFKLYFNITKQWAKGAAAM